MKKVMICAIGAALIIACMSACGTVPANSVFSNDDLANGKVIGVQEGTTGDTFASDIEGAKVEKYSKGVDAVQALKQGKIDCVMIDEEPAKVFVSKNSDLKILEEPYGDEDYAICVAKGNTELKDKINSALATIKSNGTLQSIIDNYIGDDRGKTPYVSPENVERTNGTLVMATNAEFPPYESYSNGKIVGIDVDMAQAICDILGMELRIENMEFNAIIASVQTGKADVGIAGLTVDESRLKNVDFTEPYTKSKQVLIVRAK